MGQAVAADEVDKQYYEAAKSGSLASKLLLIARDNIYSDFLHECRPTDTSTILDVGVSDVLEDGANVLERRYPHPENITACGLGTAEAFQAAFPSTRYIQIKPNVPLPFGNAQFDIATCNAVLEHVGSEAAQAAMVAEMLRVARHVFISVPNRFFPVEHHTAIPLLHYTSPTFRAACAVLGKSKWTDPQNLILMSKPRLARSFGNTPVHVSYTGIKMGPFSSNLFAVAH